MISNSKYDKAFWAGYKQGLFAATEGSKAQVVIRNDLLHVYGNLCLALHDRGWKQETIENLLFKIQERWQEECDETNARYDAGLPTEKIEHKVERITGIHLEQNVAGIENMKSGN